MASDWRIKNLTPLRANHILRTKTEELSVRRKIPQAQLKVVVSALSDTIEKFIVNEAKDFENNLPEGIDKALLDGYSELLNYFKGETGVSFSPEQRILVTDSIKELANRPIAKQPDTLLALFHFVSHFLYSKDIFLQNIRPALIKSNKETLLKIPQDTSSVNWFNSRFSREQNNCTGLREIAEKGIEPWECAGQIIRSIAYLELSENIIEKSSLARRASVNTWGVWLVGIPIDVFAFVIFDHDIDSFVELQKLLVIILNKSSNAQDGILRGILILRKMFDMFETIWKNMSDGASGQEGINVEWQLKCSIALDAWKSNELEQLMKTISLILAGNGNIGKQIGIHVLRNTFSQNELKQYHEMYSNTNFVIRETIINNLLSDDNYISSVTDVLGTSPTSGALLACARYLLISRDARSIEKNIELAELILDNYKTWLTSLKPGEALPLQSDSKELASCLAATLSELNDVQAKFNRIFNDIKISPEGWRWDCSKFLDSLPRISHLFTIGVISSDWLIERNKKQNGINIYNCVWKTFHEWLHSLCDFGDFNKEILTPLAHIWARLPSTHEDDFNSMALPALSDFSNFEWTLLATQNLRNNLQHANTNTKQLDVTLQEEIHRQFNLNIVALRHNARISEDALEQISKLERDLTPSLVSMRNNSAGFF